MDNISFYIEYLNITNMHGLINLQKCVEYFNLSVGGGGGGGAGLTKMLQNFIFGYSKSWRKAPHLAFWEVQRSSPWRPLRGEGIESVTQKSGRRFFSSYSGCMGIKMTGMIPRVTKKHLNMIGWKFDNSKLSGKSKTSSTGQMKISAQSAKMCSRAARADTIFQQKWPWKTIF